MLGTYCVGKEVKTVAEKVNPVELPPEMEQDLATSYLRSLVLSGTDPKNALLQYVRFCNNFRSAVDSLRKIGIIR